MAAWKEWATAYSTVYEALPGDSHTPCPNCGSDMLRLVFTGGPDRDVGYGAFWCDTCLQGIGISRAPIPEGATARDNRVAIEDRRPAIPNYTLGNDSTQLLG